MKPISPIFINFPISLHFPFSENREINYVKLINNMEIEFSYFPIPKKEMQIRRIPLKSFIFHLPIFLPLKGGYTTGKISSGGIYPRHLLGASRLSVFFLQR